VPAAVVELEGAYKQLKPHVEPLLSQVRKRSWKLRIGQGVLL
jgi:hypothetical protein